MIRTNVGVSRLSPSMAAAASALVVFGAAEQLTFPLALWHATDKARPLVALYIVTASPRTRTYL